MLHLLFLFVALAFGQVDFRRFLSARPEGAPATFDCAVRKYAFEYAQVRLLRKSFSQMPETSTVPDKGPKANCV